MIGLTKVRHEVLERDRLKLVNHDPLADKIDYLLEDDTLDLANVKGLEEFKTSFDPSALLDNVHKKAKGPKSKAPTTTSSKGKKRAREAARLIMVDLGQGSQNPTLPRQPTPQQQVRVCTPYYGSDLLADDDDHMPTKSLEEYVDCALIQGIVDKYEKEVEMNEGVRTLELLTLKAKTLGRSITSEKRRKRT
ncbi:uncharacterized protein LOC111410754 [Olea europaea var. sylvestris]|uniref:uncharacterized protein LOC111410754 n=1 Tax=Olea europaea var. sylvestris TaxID=158386 RepID=UPI000C1D0AB2|nr:uncharacterized protein LOC111410754 [Olea europaea var. sylvestris]XP_022897025.1 uncharacterized protein LOC111410754 [Olea europaea var. sylvestris]XP_022897026.1 uncharacterized protein LOC111410754 [Olea europaea var. sylvestris]XP_022897027.1 uncharacterized protein LOC111410754 [Olea europaea var. sylvestris]XP_022897028.1 uncharacterized protein LOC111410754 [Olea europaea var. sylvestris]XP_022897030.1 uncharacterized protein LOC111410754 [Olea europaea var. sylvestris]XP_02289703